LFLAEMFGLAVSPFIAANVSSPLCGAGIATTKIQNYFSFYSAHGIVIAWQKYFTAKARYGAYRSQKSA
jgi:hypothetical protein